MNIKMSLSISEKKKKAIWDFDGDYIASGR